MLLDSHVLLWLLVDDPRLGPKARERMATSAVVHVSAASLWEIAVKTELGRLEVPDDLPRLVEEAGLQWLPITSGHAWSTRQVTGLPHRDPFDRLLVTQAREEEMPLLTADRALLAAEIPGVTMLEARH